MATDNDTIVNNCSGDIGQGEILFSYWDTHNCPLAYQRKINTDPSNGNLQYNPTQQKAVQDKVVQLFTTYSKTNTITNNVTSPMYNPFQETLLELCLNQALPGICEKYLSTTLCTMSRDSILSNDTMTNFCGCFVPSDPNYVGYIWVTPACNAGITGCTGCSSGDTGGCVHPTACDPLCHRALSVQKANADTGIQIGCPQNVCVISDVVINAQNSIINGGINFNSVCAGCNENSGGCLCVLSGLNISETAANVGLSTNFSQYCGATSVCLVPNSTTTSTQVSCKGIDAANIGVSSTKPPNLAIMLVIVVVVIIIALFFLVVLL